MRPVIGITPSIDNEKHTHFINADNIHVISEAGGVPIILPYVDKKDEIEQIANMIDGLYLTGGNDIDPTLFHEEPHPQLGVINPIRDHYEVAIIERMLEMNKPVLAICRGCQILNIAMGGDMYQDIYSQINQQLLQHHQRAPVEHGSHYVEISKASLLHRIVEKDRIKVNSRHHQANRNPGKSVLFSGKASDGIIEVMESTRHSFVLGLQWHPENMARKGESQSKKIYASFINASKEN